MKSYDNYNEKTGMKCDESGIKPAKSLITQEEMKTIYKYPLTFIVLRLPYDRLKRCIAKTPAINYTIISQEIN